VTLVPLSFVRFVSKQCAFISGHGCEHGAPPYLPLMRRTKRVTHRLGLAAGVARLTCRGAEDMGATRKTIANCAHVTGLDNAYMLTYGRARPGVAEVSQRGRPVRHDGTFSARPSHDRLFLCHCMSKSPEDAVVKMRMGASSGLHKTEHYHQGMIRDTARTCDFAVGLAGKCCPSSRRGP